MIPGFSPADKATPKRNCVDCWSDRVVASSFRPHLSQPQRRCMKCWADHYARELAAREDTGTPAPRDDQ